MSDLDFKSMINQYIITLDDPFDRSESYYILTEFIEVVRSFVRMTEKSSLEGKNAWRCYCIYLSENGLKHDEQKRRFAILKDFFEYAESKGWLDLDDFMLTHCAV